MDCLVFFACVTIFGKNDFFITSFLLLTVGKPIEIEKCANPSQQQIDDLHLKYIESLTQLYDEHKKKYSKHPDVPITFT